MAARGFRIVSIVEYNGAVYNENGLDIPALLIHRNETGSIVNFAGGENVDKTEALYRECDVLLIPAATENVITSANADKLPLPDSVRRREWTGRRLWPTKFSRGTRCL